MARLDYEAMIKEHYRQYSRPRQFLVKSRTLPNFYDHNSYNSTHNYEGYNRMREAWKAGFPDHHVTCERIMTSRTSTVAILTFTGTHTGPFMGIPATGRPISIGAIDVIRYHRGKPVEHWGEMDLLGLLQQLGVMTVPGEHAIL